MLILGEFSGLPNVNFSQISSTSKCELFLVSLQDFKVLILGKPPGLENVFLGEFPGLPNVNLE